MGRKNITNMSIQNDYSMDWKQRCTKMYRSNPPSSEWEWENNKQQERETTKKGEKERSLKTAPFGVLHATSINSHSTAVKSRFEVLPGEQCPSTSSRCILPYQAPSHLERSETSHPPSITSDVKFLARGRGWVKIKNCIHLAIPFQQTWKRYIGIRKQNSIK